MKSDSLCDNYVCIIAFLFENLASKLSNRDVTMNILINPCLVLCIDFLLEHLLDRLVLLLQPKPIVCPLQ